MTVHLAPQAGNPQPPAAVLLEALAAAKDFAVLDGAGRPGQHTVMPDWALLEGISEEAAREARIWERHVIGVDTGLLPGAPEDSLPREGYDPQYTTLIQRYQAKAAGLSAVLGWKVSWQTVQTKRLKYNTHNTAGHHVIDAVPHHRQSPMSPDRPHAGGLPPASSPTPNTPAHRAADVATSPITDNLGLHLLQGPGEHPLQGVAAEAGVDRLPWPVAFRQVTPGNPGADLVDHAVDHPAVLPSWPACRGPRYERSE
nr:hypothetical protein [Streptomyces hygroscopicus]